LQAERGRFSYRIVQAQATVTLISLAALPSNLTQERIIRKQEGTMPISHRWPGDFCLILSRGLSVFVLVDPY
jgi:hypothetical protein